MMVARVESQGVQDGLGQGWCRNPQHGCRTSRPPAAWLVGQPSLWSAGDIIVATVARLVITIKIVAYLTQQGEPQLAYSTVLHLTEFLSPFPLPPFFYLWF